MRVTVRVNTRGQITIPAAVRRELGIVPGSQVEVEVRDGEIVLRRVKTVMEVAGSLSQYAKNAGGMSWHEMREVAERAAAAHVMARSRTKSAARRKAAPYRKREG
jgi:AbrB family looped-hinge helix DNA binding protein